jgi:hypothetical protein
MRVPDGEDNWKTRWPGWLAAGLAAARLVMLLSMPLAGLRGYGDFLHFFNMASLPGWPFFDYWVEFPPVFSFLSALLVRLSSGQQHVYDYLLFFILTLADCGSLYLFARLGTRLHALPGALVRTGLYLLALVSLAYGWWYFDPLAVFCMLLGISLLLDNRPVTAGLAVAAGILTKLFPGLVLVMVWRRWSLKRIVVLAAASLLPALVVWGALWAFSPRFTLASLQSQASKGSWETVWAMLDGNYLTGNFGDEVERLDPAAAARPIGNPPLVSPWLRLVIFAGLGLLAIWKIRPLNGTRGDLQSLALLGFTWALFLLWSPGWSPQWVLFLLPLILLILPERMAVLFGLMLVLVNLLEWPILLSRGFFWALPLTIGLRTLLLILLAVSFYQAAREESPA